MDYISQSPIHCSKVNIKCVLKCTKFPFEKSSSYIFKRYCSSSEHQDMKLGDVLSKKGGRIISHAQCLTTNYWPCLYN